MTRQTKAKLRAWLPAIVWTLLIFAVSSIPGSVTATLGVKVSDKIAHVAEFTALGLFLTIGFAGTFGIERRLLVTLSVLAVGFTIGFLDEIYQLLVPGRMAEFLDWVADSAGIIIGNRIATAFLSHRSRRRAARKQ